VVALMSLPLLAGPSLADGAASPKAAVAAASMHAIRAPAPLAAAKGPQEVGTRPWPEDWFSDLPAVDMTGTWVFDADGSDPMLAVWQDREVKYEINQQAAFILLEFVVPGSQSNTQRYSWDGTIHRFERGGRTVEEAARWTRAGRMLEIAGRHWDPTAPEDRTEYRFTYEVRGDRLVFTQESDTGTTIWRFDRVRSGGDG
jgi:hypothetical protein